MPKDIHYNTPLMGTGMIRVATVGDLKAALADQPDDMPLAVYSRNDEGGGFVSPQQLFVIDESGDDELYYAGDSLRELYGDDIGPILTITD